MTSEEIGQLLERYITAWQRHDAAGMAAAVTDDAVSEGPASGVTRGRAAIGALFGELMTAFPDSTLELHEQLIDGDRAVTAITLAGTLQAPFFGLTKTGCRLSFDMLVFYRFERSGIAHLQVFYDFAGALLKSGTLSVRPS